MLVCSGGCGGSEGLWEGGSSLPLLEAGDPCLALFSFILQQEEAHLGHIQLFAGDSRVEVANG